MKELRRPYFFSFIRAVSILQIQTLGIYLAGGNCIFLNSDSLSEFYDRSSGLLSVLSIFRIDSSTWMSFSQILVIGFGICPIYGHLHHKAVTENRSFHFFMVLRFTLILFINVDLQVATKLSRLKNLYKTCGRIALQLRDDKRWIQPFFFVFNLTYHN